MIKTYQDEKLYIMARIHGSGCPRGKLNIEGAYEATESGGKIDIGSRWEKHWQGWHSMKTRDIMIQVWDIDDKHMIYRDQTEILSITSSQG